MFRKNLLQDGNFIMIQTRVGNLELEIEKLKTHINSLRGLINRKQMAGTIEPTETIKSVDGLDSMRKINGNNLS